LAPTSAGILLHELIGHGAEEKWFGLAPGCRIGPRHLNVLATPPTGQRFDDEGIMTASRVLVEDGRLAEPLADRMTCSKGERPAGLAQAGAHYGPPRVRCTHIRVEGGEHDSGDLVADTGEGLYLPEIAQATVHDGVVVFRVVLARWIQGGLLGPPAEPFVVVMSLVSLAGQLAAVAGPPRSGRASRCSKRGDALPSTLVAPTLRIRNARVLPVRIPS
jgi:predicted Zn-dependent protease